MDYLFIVVIVLALVFIAGLSAYSFYKIRRIDKNVSELLFQVGKLYRTDLIDLFQQHQYLDILQKELSLKHPLPPTRGWAASPDFLLTIARHARQAGPEVVVECSSGVSTLVLASILRDLGKGHVYSLENDESFAEKTRADLERENLSEWATVVPAPLKSQDVGGRSFSWYDLDKLPEMAIDMIVVDGPPQQAGAMARYPAGPKLFPKLAAGGTVYVDDASREQEEPTLAAWRKEFPELTESFHYCEKGCVSFHRPAG